LECISLINVPLIPRSITNLWMTFYNCRSLVIAPEIPNSITDMYYTFYGCSNLTGNIYIRSNQISNATNCFHCFNSLNLSKNVFIPFTYENGINTKTYKSFISAGYDTVGTKDGVYLKDINATPTEPLPYQRDSTKDLVYNYSTNSYELANN